MEAGWNDRTGDGVQRRHWPEFDHGGAWAAMQDYLQLVTQMLGKLRLALAPPLPEWGHTPLAMTPRGFTTRALAGGCGSVEATFDVLDGVLRITTSDGRSGSVDVRPFSADDRPRAVEPALARSWFALLTDLHETFDAWRSPFFGRSGVNFWWGGFDLTVTLFSGRPATPRPGSNYLMRYDLDAEHVSIGFWPGDETHAAMFFAYFVPEPPACADYPLDEARAAWAATMGEWVLPYEALREAADPRAVLRRFMDTIWRAAGDLAGWDLAAYAYAAPERPERTP